VAQKDELTARITDQLSEAMKCGQRHDDQVSTELPLNVTDKSAVFTAPYPHV